MKYLVLSICLVATFLSCKDKSEKSQEELTAERIEEQKANTPPEEWTVLFDGTSLDAWKEFQKDSVSDAWKIEENALVFYPPQDRARGDIYDLTTKDKFTDFILSLEWKISEGGNSGVMWAVQEDKDFSRPYQTGPEIQVLDNVKHPDAKAGDSHKAGALYDLQAPSKDVTKPVGQWNTMVITVNNKESRGLVELNGEQITDFSVGNEIWDAMVAKSKFADWDGFGKFTQGKIVLQDHGNIVSYRNIKIKEL